MGIVYVTDESDMTLVHRDMCAGDLRVPGIEPICNERISLPGREDDVSLWPLGFTDRRGNKLWIEHSMLHSWGTNDPRAILASFKMYANINVIDIW